MARNPFHFHMNSAFKIKTIILSVPTRSGQKVPESRINLQCDFKDAYDLTNKFTLITKNG